MLIKCNLVGNFKKWWINSGVTCHVCSNRELFSFYTSSGPGEIIVMENFTMTKIEGTDKIGLKMTSSKMVTLNHVLHVFEMRKNLISKSLLVKKDFKCVFLYDKVVTNRNYCHTPFLPN